MKVSHTIASINISGGGPSRSATTLVSSLGRAAKDDVFSLHSLRSDELIQTAFAEPNCSLSVYDLNRFKFFTGFQDALKKENADVYHGHGIWNLSIHQMAKYARNAGKPYLISPRGMLEQWSLEQSRWKKKLALALYQRKDLQGANCLHATAEKELENIRRLGLKNPVALIPNGISTEAYPARLDPPSGTKKILFLSRIHPSKGIDHLIEAWEKVDPQLRADWKVEIIGNGKPEYIRSLEQSIMDKGISGSISIKEPVFGDEKVLCYQSADLFVLPTYSENFGLVVAEALSCGVPVITTKGAPWSDLREHHCGWWIEVGTDPLVKCLETVLPKTREELFELGKNGRKLVEEKYSISAVSRQMLDVYRWLSGNGPRPDCIR